MNKVTKARLAVDIGGTFTDVVVDAMGRMETAKVLTTSQAPEEAVLTGIETVLALSGLKPVDIGILIHGTTLATNAIIERKGAVTALITTEGFRDILDIAYETRFDQYDVFIDKTKPLIPRYLRLPAPERVSVHGEILRPLDESAVRALLPVLDTEGVTSVAVGFLHAYANDAHERRVREILHAERPNLHVTLSSEVCPEVREYERLTTASANAYVQPLMGRYLTRLKDDLKARGFTCPVFLMTSGGGLTTLETAIRFPIRLVESGPAGGAILATGIAAECGADKALSFDMGGTTAKICLIEDYRPETGRSFEVARAARFQKGSGLQLRIPVIEMVEIGAGGGSIAKVDTMKQIQIGPESAGSEPGPACYDRGGLAPTVTDGDVVLGRIDPDSFAGGKVTLVPEKSGEAIEVAVGAPLALDRSMAAFGIIEMVDENMANAARVHAIERGRVIAEHTMIAFGGAAPLHASRLAEKLGVNRVIVPTNAGVGSAIGFLRAPVAYEVVRSRYMTLDNFDVDQANNLLSEMRAEANEVVRAGAGGAALMESRLAYMRYQGQGHEIVVALPNRDLRDGDEGMLKVRYEAAYEALFSRIIPGADIEILTWAMTVSTETDTPTALGDVVSMTTANADGVRTIFDPEREIGIEASLYRRADLKPGMSLQGPALITEDETSTFVSVNFDASVNAAGYIVLERRG